MADATKTTKRGNSKPNVKRRGSTYAYYLYVTGPDGKRRQHSKGGSRLNARPGMRGSRRPMRRPPGAT